MNHIKRSTSGSPACSIRRPLLQRLHRHNKNPDNNTICLEAAHANAHALDTQQHHACHHMEPAAHPHAYLYVPPLYSEKHAAHCTAVVASALHVMTRDHDRPPLGVTKSNRVSLYKSLVVSDTCVGGVAWDGAGGGVRTVKMGSKHARCQRKREKRGEGSLSGEDNASPGSGTAWRSHNPRGGIGRVRHTRSHSQSWGTETQHHRTIRL